MTSLVLASVRENTPPDTNRFKQRIVETLWSVIDRYPWITSATITGSFLTAHLLEAISDIDLVVIVDSLDQSRFDELQSAFRSSLAPVLREQGWKLKLNPTLGPLKFNEDDTAVLHLMLYSRAAHIDHVLKSPFTCLDWSRSHTWRTAPMSEIYPTLNLQPRHFLSARRSFADYLKDFKNGVISYRELEFAGEEYREYRREQPMSSRDRLEFGYHVMRFLMTNLLKLLRRENRAYDTDELLLRFFDVFPDRQEEFVDLYRQLERRKKHREFVSPAPQLERSLEAFVDVLEVQFRRIFVEQATRHVLVRHAPTALNQGVGEQRVFLGRSDPSVLPMDAASLNRVRSQLETIAAERVFSSPLVRCRQTLHAIGASLTTTDERLLEIDYGDCEGLTVGEARSAHPSLFSAWEQGKDPAFPGGESTRDVLNRVSAFAAEHWKLEGPNTLCCTHNVVLRCLLGHLLGLDPSSWHRLRVPHLRPFTVIQTRGFGMFVDIDEPVQRELLSGFVEPCN